MAYRIMLGDKEVYKDTDKVSNKEIRQAFATLMLTKSADTDSAKENATKLGGLVYAGILAKLPDDLTVTIYEKPEGKTEEKKRGHGPITSVINKIKTAMTQEERAFEIFPYSSEKGSAKEDKPSGSADSILAEFGL